MKSIVLAMAVIGASASFGRAQIIYNGDFQTGNLDGWTTFTTSDGTLGSAAVTQFDVAGTGTLSDAAQFRVGEVNFNGTQQGGGISQTFNVSAGQYLISADFAAQTASFNQQAGVETVSVDSVTVGTLVFGNINAGQTERGVVEGTLNLSGGTHEITIEFTRPWITTIETPFEYVNNVEVTAVPEPSLAALGLCVVSVVCVKKSRRSLRQFLRNFGP